MNPRVLSRLAGAALVFKGVFVLVLAATLGAGLGINAFPVLLPWSAVSAVAGAWLLADRRRHLGWIVAAVFIAASVLFWTYFIAISSPSVRGAFGVLIAFAATAAGLVIAAYGAERRGEAS